MKKIVKFLAAGLIICTAGGAFMGCGSEKNSGPSEQQNVGSSQTVLETEGTIYRQEKRKLAYSGTAVKAELKHIDLIVRPSEDDSFYLEYVIRSKESKKPLSVGVQDGRLILKEEKAEAAGFYQRIEAEDTGDRLKAEKEHYTSVLTLYVPSEQQLTGFTAQLGEGDMTVQKLHVNSAEVFMEEGDLSLSGGAIYGGRLSLIDGDLEAENTKLLGKVEMKADSGDLFIKLEPSQRHTLSILADTEMDIEAAKKLGGRKTETDEKTFYERTVKHPQAILKAASENGDIQIEVR